MIVEPCWKHPVSWPLHDGVPQPMRRGPPARRSRSEAEKPKAVAGH